LSPRMHQAAFEHLGLPHFYAALELAPKYFKKLMIHRAQILLDGFNVTIPYKQVIIPYLDSVSPEARLIGAVNTVRVRRGRFLGENTDAYGFLRLLREEFRWKSNRKKVLILGAGGAARACMTALLRDGVRQICILNRTPSKARGLALDFKNRFPKVPIDFAPLTGRKVREELLQADLVVHTTSVGLKVSDTSIVAKKDFPKVQGKRFAVDLIYNPPQTEFLRLAKAAGWKTANGLGMLLYQGAKAFELWTGRKAPVDVMRKALLFHNSK
ncbi:MAG: shikimate dehydrogenase, partial [Candidatus Omnitrophica bacterium]|nr:shikimate dehydrogenase [Candidatus Omnitrophota bacterium]